MWFNIKTEQNNKMSFLDVTVIYEQGNLQQMFIKNQLFVVYAPILIDF